MTDRQLAIRILLAGIILTLGVAPLLTSCAAIFPVEQGTLAEALNSRYVTDEMRAAHADLNSGPLAQAIEDARMK